jgi:hypothetical protein
MQISHRRRWVFIKCDPVLCEQQLQGGPSCPHACKLKRSFGLETYASIGDFFIEIKESFNLDRTTSLKKNSYFPYEENKNKTKQKKKKKKKTWELNDKYEFRN